MQEENVSLVCSDFKHNLWKCVIESLGSKDFLDVTLVCEGRSIKAHRLILSFSSIFLKDLLKSITNGKEAVLLLNGVKHSSLLHLIKYIYVGEIKIRQDELQDFVNAAEALKINSLDDIKRRKFSAPISQSSPNPNEESFAEEICETPFRTHYRQPFRHFGSQNNIDQQSTPTQAVDIQRRALSDPCSSVNRASGTPCSLNLSRNNDDALQANSGRSVTLFGSLRGNSDNHSQVNDEVTTIRSFPFSVINDNLQVSSYAESYLGSPAPAPHAPVQTGLSKRIPKFLDQHIMDDWQCIKYEITARGCVLNFQGQRFYKHGSYGLNVYWRCIKSREACKARAKTYCRNPKMFEIKGVHNHPIP